MRMQRLYQLPNCQLVVEGFSDVSASDRPEALRIVTAVECRFPLQGQILQGNRDWLTQLLEVVRSGAQRWVSGVERPETRLQREQVQLQPTEAGAVLTSRLPDREPQVLTLSTVELFDLTEAVDQLLADPMTLPDLSLSIDPLPRREVPPEAPLTERAVAPAAGVAVLVAASAIFYGMTPPKVKLPTEHQTELSKVLPPAPIRDPQQRAKLAAGLKATLSRDWQGLPDVSEPLRYSVSVTAKGAIAGVRGRDVPAIRRLAETPLKNAKPAGAVPLADFEVTLNPDGQIQVQP